MYLIDFSKCELNVVKVSQWQLFWGMNQYERASPRKLETWARGISVSLRKF